MSTVDALATARSTSFPRPTGCRLLCSRRITVGRVAGASALCPTCHLRCDRHSTVAPATTRQKGTRHGRQPDQGWKRIADQGGSGPHAVAVGLGWDGPPPESSSTSTPARSRAAPTSESSPTSTSSSSTTPLAGGLHRAHRRQPDLGEGDGDDEVINVDLAGTPPNIDSIVFPVSTTTPTRAQPVVRPGAQRLHPGRQSRERLRDRPLRPVRGCVDRNRQWSSASSTATALTGSSVPSARDTRQASRALPATSASTSDPRPAMS